MNGVPTLGSSFTTELLGKAGSRSFWRTLGRMVSGIQGNSLIPQCLLFIDVWCFFSLKDSIERKLHIYTILLKAVRGIDLTPHSHVSGVQCQEKVPMGGQVTCSGARLSASEEKGCHKGREESKHKWGEVDSLHSKSFQGKALFLLHSYPVTHPFPRVLECSSYWESSPSESKVFPRFICFQNWLKFTFWYPET